MVIITTPTQPHTCSALSFSQGWDISLDGPSIISLFASEQQIRSSRFLCAVGLHGMQWWYACIPKVGFYIECRLSFSPFPSISLQKAKQHMKTTQETRIKCGFVRSSIAFKGLPCLHTTFRYTINDCIHWLLSECMYCYVMIVHQEWMYYNV